VTETAPVTNRDGDGPAGESSEIDRTIFITDLNVELIVLEPISEGVTALRRQGIGYVLRESIPHAHRHYVREHLLRRTTELNGVRVRVADSPTISSRGR